MELVNYLKSRSFVRSVPDWCVAIALLVYFFAVAEHARPFMRQFSIEDLTISHPFAYQERVTGLNCILIAFFVPTITIIAVSIVKSRRSIHQQALDRLQISLLGLGLSLSMNGVVTDILKNWISRPRPDFLARCGPKTGTPHDVLVDISVCTAPLGQVALIDGMRSTPSGHSSISFSALLYLSLWLVGQFRIFSSKQPQPVYKILLCSLPVLLATYIGLSRTQDYRHHFVDVALGSSLGSAFAVILYFRYFPSLWAEDSAKPLDTDEANPVLPI